jgi:hypothetical protein
MWHPQLKRTWLDNDKFIIENKARRIPANLELLQLNSRTNSFLIKKDNKPNQKLNCGCKFIKDDNKHNAKKPIIENSSSQRVQEEADSAEVDSLLSKFSTNTKERINNHHIVPMNFLQIKENKQIPLKSPKKDIKNIPINHSPFEAMTDNQKKYNQFNQIDKENKENSNQSTNSNMNYQPILDYLRRNEILLQNLKNIIMMNSNNNQNRPNSSENIIYHSPLLENNSNHNTNFNNLDSPSNIYSNNLPFPNQFNRKIQSETTSIPNNFFEQFIKKNSNYDNPMKENNYNYGYSN